jgi:hypothetical protein
MWGAGVTIPGSNLPLMMDGYRAPNPPVTPAEISATCFVLQETGFTQEQVEEICAALIRLGRIR